MYAFVHLEKTAGTTLISILRRSFGAGHCDYQLPQSKRNYNKLFERPAATAEDLRRLRRVYRNLQSIAAHFIKVYSDLHEECPEIRFFTVLRDPVARFRSHFFNRSPDCSRAGFEAWMAATYNHNWQTRMIAGEQCGKKAIELIEQRIGFVGITERFDESLVMLAHWMNSPKFKPEYQRQNVMSNKKRPKDVARAQVDLSYLELPEIRQRICEANRQDQIVYDHVMQQIYPRQIANYPGDLAADTAALQARNKALRTYREPISSIVMRNYIYKPLRHCHAA